jgi:hypothetical protein
LLSYCVQHIVFVGLIEKTQPIFSCRVVRDAYCEKEFAKRSQLAGNPKF